MHILLTNDDGVFAPGIRALAEAFRGAGHRVSVCAPDRERSAASHSVTLATDLHPKRLSADWAERIWAVDGTPADCASLGLFLANAEEPVDMVVAGINRGMNLGGACVYSGTVGAALEAAMCGVQALAVSLCIDPSRREPEDYGPAARAALRVAEWMPAHPLPVPVTGVPRPFSTAAKISSWLTGARLTCRGFEVSLPAGLTIIMGTMV